MENFQFPFYHKRKIELSESIQQLIKAAEEAAEKAYAPYSHFQVGAAVLMKNGTFLTGANHENAAYPAGVCAERAALSSLVMTDKTKQVEAIVVTHINKEVHDKPISPCGICRQTILEVQQWQGSPIAVYMCGPDEQVVIIENAEYLLPFSFGSDYLVAPLPETK